MDSDLPEDKFIILRDTREQKGWSFGGLLQKGQLLVDKKLDQGDYALNGLEKYCIIERKKSLDEIINNLCSKNEKARLIREIERLIKNSINVYFVFSFTVDDILKGSKYSKISPNYILSILTELEIKYGIKIVYAGKNAEYITYRLLSKTWSYYVKKERRL